MFWFVESDWSIVRRPRLFLRIDMILRTLASTHTGYWIPRENFPVPFKVKCDVHWNPFFKALKMVSATFSFEGVSKLSNHRQLTFEIIESVRGVVWHSRLFLRIAMILRMLASTHVGYWRLKENFLTALKVKRDVHWNPFFEGPKMVKATFAFEGGMKTQKSPSPHVWDHRVC